MKPSRIQIIAYIVIVLIIIGGYFLYHQSQDKYKNISHAETYRIGDVYTGVYHRPACPQAQDIKSDVAKFENNEKAREAKFSPCKHCKPDQD